MTEPDNGTIVPHGLKYPYTSLAGLPSPIGKMQGMCVLSYFATTLNQSIRANSFAQTRHGDVL